MESLENEKINPDNETRPKNNHVSWLSGATSGKSFGIRSLNPRREWSWRLLWWLSWVELNKGLSASLHRKREREIGAKVWRETLWIKVNSDDPKIDRQLAEWLFMAEVFPTTFISIKRSTSRPFSIRQELVQHRPERTRWAFTSRSGEFLDVCS